MQFDPKNLRPVVPLPDYIAFSKKLQILFKKAFAQYFYAPTWNNYPRPLDYFPNYPRKHNNKYKEGSDRP